MVCHRFGISCQNIIATKIGNTIDSLTSAAVTTIPLSWIPIVNNSNPSAYVTPFDIPKAKVSFENSKSGSCERTQTLIKNAPEIVDEADRV